MAIRNSDCINCTLHQGCGFVCEMVEPTIQGGLMVIGDYPSSTDDTLELRPLSENKFDIFWKIAKDVCMIDSNQVYTTYATKCKPKEGSRPTEDQNIVCASSYLRKEINRIKPKAILLLGTLPAQAFGYKQPVGKIRGQLKKVTLGKDEKQFITSIIVAQSPSYVQYNSKELESFARDIDKAWQVVTGHKPSEDLPTLVTMCITIAEVEQLIEYVKITKECTFDFETTKLTDLGIYDTDFKATLLAISFQHGSAYTIPLFHFDSPFTKEEVDYILQRIADEIWSNPKIHKINQNIKFDMNVAARYGHTKFCGRISCTMVMHSLFDDLSKHGIKSWLPNFFPQFRGWDAEMKDSRWNMVALKPLSDYAGIDADGAFRGFTALEQKLLEDQRVYDLFRNLYMFALKPLFNMERRGMLIDREAILGFEARALELITIQENKMNDYIQVQQFCTAKREQVINEKLNELRVKKSTAKGKNFEKYKQKIAAIKQGKIKVYDGINFGSVPQLSELLYTHTGFRFKAPYDKKTRGLKEVTGEIALKSLGDKSGFVNDLLVLRSLRNNYSKYLFGMRSLMDADDCVHTTYSQSRVKTGRLSSSSPNLQNISSHIKIQHPFVEEVTVMAKKAFVVSTGYAMLNFDFSQAELRMIAELAVEQNMIDAYNNNQDLHAVTAAAIMNKTFDAFMLLPDGERKPLRQKGKSANFGLIFDQSPEGFKDYAANAYGVKITQAEATKIHSAFFTTYPKIAEYHEVYRAKGRKFGYVRTVFGRRGHYPDIRSLDNFLRGNAERELVNFPVQGSNAENTVLAMALLEYRLPKEAYIVNSVHDSIMIICPYHLVSYVVKLGIDTCVNTPQLKFFGKEMVHLKMSCDAEISLTNWKSLKTYDEAEWKELYNSKLKHVK